MQAVKTVSGEMLERIKALMVQDGVALTDDLNQCEAALLEFVQRLGNSLLQDHFSKKRLATRDQVGCAPAEPFRSS